MAETPLGNQLTQVHGVGQRAIVDKVVKQMLTIWPLLDVTDLDATQTAWLNAAVQIVLAGRQESEALASGYLQAFYATELPTHQPVIVRPTLDDAVEQAIRTSLQVTGPVHVKQMTAAGYGLDYASQSAFKATAGVAQRHAANGGRETVLATAEADPITMGWRRVIVGDTCSFCRMLADRGAVYASNTVRFSAHDNDDCVAEPAIAGEPVNLAQYTASKRSVTQAEKDRLKQFLHEEYDGPKPSGTKSDPLTGKAPKEVRDVDAGKSRAELQAVYDALAPSYAKFPSAGTKRRMDDLAAKIAAL